MTQEELLQFKQSLKDYLNITWDDPVTENNLTSFIKSGEAYLNRKVFGDSDKKLDFINDYEANQLLKDYCRYAYNHSLEVFEENFFHKIFDLQLREGVKDIEENTDETPS